MTLHPRGSAFSTSACLHLNLGMLKDRDIIICFNRSLFCLDAALDRRNASLMEPLC